MNTDIRIHVGFWQHPKTKRLIRDIGLEGVRSLQILWCWVAQHRCDGNISDLDCDDIEAAADWNGPSGDFYMAIKDRWLEEVNDELFIHDWTDHNSWAADAGERSDVSRLMKLSQVNREAYNALIAQGRKGIDKHEYLQFKRGYNSDTLAARNSVTQAECSAVGCGPAPAPAPSPSPKEKEKNIAPTVSKNRNGSKPSSPIFLDDDFQWQGVTDAHLSTWSAAYPACDIPTELMRSALYIRAHPNKRKKNWERYIIGWFGRAQEWGGTKGKRDSWDIDAWANEKDAGVQ